MSTETSIEALARVLAEDAKARYEFARTLGAAFVKAFDCAVPEVAKASYTDVKPAEHWKITALREAWKPVFLDDLENSADEDHEDAAEGRLARAVLAVIDLIPPNSPVTGGPAAGVGCGQGRQPASEADGGPGESSDPRTADELQAEVTKLQTERDEAREAEGHAAHYVEHWCERAKAAEAASSQLVEAMEKLADEFVKRCTNVQVSRQARNAYSDAVCRIRAAVKAATESRVAGGEK